MDVFRKQQRARDQSRGWLGAFIDGLLSRWRKPRKFRADGATPASSLVGGAASAVEAMMSQERPPMSESALPPTTAIAGSPLAALLTRNESIALATDTNELLTLDSILQGLGKTQCAALDELRQHYGVEPRRAPALIIAGLLPDSLEVRRLALTHLSRHLGAGIVQAVAKAAPALQQLPPLARFALLCETLPQVDALSDAQRQRLYALAQFLARLPGGGELRRELLQRLLHARVQILAEQDALPLLKLADCSREICELFQILAHIGQDSPERAAQAYAAGLKGFLAPALRAPWQAPGADWRVRLELALARVVRLHPAATTAMLAGMVATVAVDGQLAPAEAELLRSVCLLTGLPLPAFPAMEFPVVRTANAGHG